MKINWKLASRRHKDALCFRSLWPSLKSDAHLEDDVIDGDDVGVGREQEWVVELAQEVLDGDALLVDGLQDDLVASLPMLRQVDPREPTLRKKMWISTSLPLASTWWVWSTLASHSTLLFKQRCWLTSASSTIFSSGKKLGMLGIKSGATGSGSKYANHSDMLPPCEKYKL